MRFTPVVVGITLAIAAAGPLEAQADPDPGQPRPPLLLEVSRTERLETAVRMYLVELIGSIQRGDTVVLKALVPDAVVPGAEKAVASRAGCPSPGVAAARLLATRRANASTIPLPNSDVVLSGVTISLMTDGDTVARVETRIAERWDRRTRFAPLALVFADSDGTLKVSQVNGLLAGLCGLALARE